MTSSFFMVCNLRYVSTAPLIANMIRLTCAVLLAVLALHAHPALGRKRCASPSRRAHGTTSLNPLDRCVKALEARFRAPRTLRSAIASRSRSSVTCSSAARSSCFISTSGVSRRNLSEGSRDLLASHQQPLSRPEQVLRLALLHPPGQRNQTPRGHARAHSGRHSNGPYSYLVGMGEMNGQPMRPASSSRLMQSAEDVV